MMAYGMDETKNKGGRGVRAENKYERLTVTLPPELKNKLDALATVSGLNRSEMLAKVIQDHGPEKRIKKPVIPVIPELPQTQKLVPVKTSKVTEHSTPLPDSTEDGLVGLTVLQVVSSVIPQRLKNCLRWSPDRYAELERVLRGTKVVRLDVNNGKAVWRGEDGLPMRKDTVKQLHRAGVLVSV